MQLVVFGVPLFGSFILIFSAPTDLEQVPIIVARDPLASQPPQPVMAGMIPGAGVAGQQETCQWALHDTLTGSLKQSQWTIPPSTEQVAAFQSLAGVAHDTLAAPGVTQVYLRRRSGSILSRRLFAKELHWFTHFSAPGHERFAEFMERNRNIAFADRPEGQLF